MNRNGAKIITGATGLAAAVGAVSYPLFFRRRCLTWGALAGEAAEELPGDELLREAGLVTTRAISIAAPPDAVWPWLVQMGSGRGGAYTYDWIENLFGLDMHSAEEILPQFQQIAVGDELPMGPDRPVMRVEVCEPERALAIRLDDPKARGGWVWIFALFREGETTRLLSRNRISAPDASLSARLFSLYVMEPGSLVMERKMLLGIKRRAERLARQRAQAEPAAPTEAAGQAEPAEQGEQR